MISAVKAEDQDTILKKLNEQAADGVFYIKADEAAANLTAGTYSTIYVGNTSDLDVLGSFSGIAETTGKMAAATSGDNAFVIVNKEYDIDALVSTIAHEAGHLMGTVEHDYGMDGLTLDDFMEDHIAITTDTTYKGTVYSGYTAPASGNINGGAFQVSSGLLTLEEVTIGSCRTTATDNGWGGGISVNGTFGTTGGLVLTKSLIANCSCGRAGGAINISNGRSDGSAVVAITGSTFTNNSATNNIAGGHPYGGAIFAHGYSVHFTVEDSFFYNNHAFSGSGAIAMVSATAEITGSTFSGNDGAIALNTSFISTVNQPRLTLTNCAFTTKSDTIAISNGTATLVGKNIFAANVTKGSSANIYGSASAEYTFNADSEITQFQVSLGTGSKMTFDKVTSGKISFGNLINNDASHVAETNVTTGSTLIGDITQVASNVTWLTAGSSNINFNGKTIQVSSASDAEVRLAGGTLTVGYKFKSRAEDAAQTSLEFTASNYTEDFSTVTLGGAKTVTGQGTDITTLNGNKLYADGNELTISKLQYSGRINGDNVYSADSTTKAVNLTLGTDAEAMKIVAGTKVSRIYGGADITAKCTLTGGENITLNIHLTDDSVVGNVYGGGCLSIANSSYTIGTINTTIDGGTYLNYVGNGTQANTGCSVTQGASTLTIKSGTFNNFVYAGGYCQAANTVSVGATTLNISGGTFNSKVLGGCAASSNNAFTSGTSVVSTSILVDTTSNDVAFYDNLVAGSSGTGSIEGDTTITFKGSGSNLFFNSSAAGKGFVQGGSTGERASATSKGNVDGDRELAFDYFTGNFCANARNSFDTVTFTSSSVTFTGATEVDLRYVDNWGFDISDDVIDLTWTNNSARTANDFTGDTLNISGTLSSGSKVLMAGDDTTLKNWEKIATLNIGGMYYTNQGLVDDYVKFQAANESCCKLSVVDNQLTLGTLV